MQMESIIREKSWKEQLGERENWLTIISIMSMRETGIEIYQKEKVSKSGVMDPILKEHSRVESSRVLENISRSAITNMKAHSKAIR